jgi:hypothetical protein
VRRRALILLLLAAGCAAHEPATSPTGTEPAIAVGEMPPELPARELRDAALAFAEAWAEARRSGDAPTLAARYGDAFEGIDPRGDTHDRDWWLARESVLGPAALEIEIDRVETWLDAGSTLARGRIELVLEQRIERAPWPVHGPVRLELELGDAGLAVIHEAWLDLAPGFSADDAWAVMAGDGPIASAAAIEVWGRLGPRGADWRDRIDALGDDPRVLRPLARAVLAEGDVVCRRSEWVEDCQDGHPITLPPEPDEDLAAPCLRRELARWAALEGGLSATDAKSVLPTLRAMVAAPAHDDELAAAAMALSVLLPVGDRTELLAAFASRPGAEVEPDWLAGLADDTLLALADEGVDLALTRLDATRHKDRLLRALDDDDVAATIRADLLGLVEDTPSAELDRVLTRLTLDESCDLAAHAARLLADRGLETWLPSRPIGDDPVELARSLCVLGSLAHEDERGWTLWAEYLPPDDLPGGWTATLAREWVEHEGSPPAREIRRRDLASLQLPALGEDTVCTPTEDGGTTCRSGAVSVDLARAGDGRRYVRAIREGWSNCGC